METPNSSNFHLRLESTHFFVIQNEVSWRRSMGIPRLSKFASLVRSYKRYSLYLTVGTYGCCLCWVWSLAIQTFYFNSCSNCLPYCFNSKFERSLYDWCVRSLSFRTFLLAFRSVNCLLPRRKSVWYGILRTIPILLNLVHFM